MSHDLQAGRELLEAEIAALERLRDRERAELATDGARVQRENARTMESAREEALEQHAVAEASSSAADLEARIEEVRRQAALARAAAESARLHLGRETAVVRGLLARVMTVADVLGDASLRRWARRVMGAGEAE